MELAEARALVKAKTDKDITVRHLISVEGVMRALARRLGQDEGWWVRSVTTTSARLMSAWSGHAEPTGPGCRQGRARVLTGLGRRTPRGGWDGFGPPDEANGEGEA
jgi:hypothetical protein